MLVPITEARRQYLLKHNEDLLLDLEAKISSVLKDETETLIRVRNIDEWPYVFVDYLLGLGYLVDFEIINYETELEITIHI